MHDAKLPIVMLREGAQTNSSKSRTCHRLIVWVDMDLERTKPLARRVPCHGSTLRTRGLFSR